MKTFGGWIDTANSFMTKGCKRAWTHNFTPPTIDATTTFYDSFSMPFKDFDFGTGDFTIQWVSPQMDTWRYFETSYVAWCPECKKEYQLDGYYERFNCPHPMTDEELGNTDPMNIRDISNFVELKHIECFVFEIKTEKW